MAKGVYGDQILIPGISAGASLTTKQWHPVKMASTANEVISAIDTTDVLVGILQNDPADGEAALVCALGISRAIAGTGNIAVNDILSANSSGVYDTSGGTAANDYFVGRALEASTAIGDHITIFVSPGAWYRA